MAMGERTPDALVDYVNMLFKDGLTAREISEITGIKTNSLFSMKYVDENNLREGTLKWRQRNSFKIDPVSSLTDEQLAAIEKIKNILKA